MKFKEMITENYSSFENKLLVDVMSFTLLLFGVLTFGINKYLIIPWGKFKDYHSKEWIFQCKVNSQLAWTLMECPGLLIAIYGIWESAHIKGISFNKTCLMLYALHYLYRAFIYPILAYDSIGVGKKDFSLVIMLSALCFNLYNGTLQTIGLLGGSPLEFQRQYTHFDYIHLDYIWNMLLKMTYLFVSHEKSPMEKFLEYSRITTGIFIFGLGLYINVRSDLHLIGLKRQHRDETYDSPANIPVNSSDMCPETYTKHRENKIHLKHYKIPHDGLFQYVSCANYFGEIIEWFGYSILCCNTSSFSFTLFTLFFLGSRARQQHLWYNEVFPNYPKNRKAFLPFLL